MREHHPFVQLFLARLREVGREPGVLFWIFGFPVLLAVGLGLAFREKQVEPVLVGVVEARGAESIATALEHAGGFRVERVPPAQGDERLRLGKLTLLVLPQGEPAAGALPAVEYRYDPTRPDGLAARSRVDDALQRAAGRVDPLAARDELVTAPGSRYIDFLIPGLLGMNIMSGGMWGVGFALVEMRSRRLLKQLMATPMRRGHFLGAVLASRMVLVFAEMLLLLFFGWLVFGMKVVGSAWLVTLLVLLGAASFAGLGLLVASRARKVETVSGLMNLVMLPMFVFSGVFFSAERFPAALQPLVQALPLTALNDALRAVILEGAGLVSQLPRLAILVAWGLVPFLVALRAFRWN